MKRVLKGLTVGLIVSFGFSASRAFAATNATVVDGCADLSHPRLQKTLNVNQAELNGIEGVDDDHNGFIDDVLGWNISSNDAHYMPEWILKIFSDNHDDVSQMIALYNGVENDEPAAIEKFKKNPDLADAVGAILEASHGTHVSGLVSRFSQGTARLQNIDVKYPSTKGNSRLQELLPSSRLQRLKALALKLAEHPASTSGNSAEFQSIFDDQDMIDAALLKPMRESETADSNLVRDYLSANRSRVVNVSLGTTLEGVVDAIEGIWEQELQKAGLERTTPRSPTQEENFKHTVLGIWKIEASYWSNILTAHPDVVFVVAASNEGKDLGDFPVLPAFYGKSLPNVIAVAATDANGLLTDFSNYSAEQVSLGAWGKAVPSLAPAGIENVLMSGTSMASPVVAGIVTAMRDANPALSALEIRKILEGTVTHKGSLEGKTITAGMVNGPLAIQTAREARHGDVAAALQAAQAARLTQRWMHSLNDFLSLPESGDGTEGKTLETPEILKKLIRQSL